MTKLSLATQSALLGRDDGTSTVAASDMIDRMMIRPNHGQRQLVETGQFQRAISAPFSEHLAQASDPARALLPQNIFFTTARGYAEMQSDALALSPRMFRALVLVNGVRTVEKLVLQLRSADALKTLRELETGGYIERVGSSGAEPSVSRYTETLSPEQFSEIKRVIINDLHARLGSADDFAVEEIARSENAMELRSALRIAGDILLATLGEAAVVEHLRAVGKKVMGLTAPRIA